jgi:hypothetical protein
VPDVGRSHDVSGLTDAEVDIRPGRLMDYEVAVRSRPEYDGALVKVRVDTVVQPDGSQAEREVVEHVGSVAVVAIDDQRRVLLIRQYRHPAGQYLWELPAGLCDKPGEPPLGTAQRNPFILPGPRVLRQGIGRSLVALRLPVITRLLEAVLDRTVSDPVRALSLAVGLDRAVMCL